jgi:hypothetical protein
LIKVFCCSIRFRDSLLNLVPATFSVSVCMS